MTKEELDDFLARHRNIEWQLEPDAMLFRNINLPWYQEADHHATRVTNKKLEELDEAQLLHQINAGLDVDQITRVTGYMGKVNKFNPGKRGELNDRVRHDGVDATDKMEAIED